MTEDPPDHDAWTARQTGTTVTVDGHDLRVAYTDRGDGDPLLFLHGIPTWGYLWRRVAPAFEADHRVVVPDLLGYGNSASHDGFDRSIRAQEAMLVALLDDLGIGTATVVAHDVGGGAALRLAAHTDRVDRLVLSNAVCYDSWPVEFIADLGLPATAGMDDGEFERTLEGAFAGGTYDEADPAFVAGMKAPWLQAGGKTALARAAVATNTNHTTELDYGAVDADLLALWAVEDAMQPIEYAERLVDEVGGDLRRLEAAYHWVVEDRPAAYREELSAWLAEAGEVTHG